MTNQIQPPTNDKLIVQMEQIQEVQDVNLEENIQTGIQEQIGVKPISQIVPTAVDQVDEAPLDAPAQEESALDELKPELPLGDSEPATMVDFNQHLIFSAEELLQNKMDKIPTLWEPFFPKVGLVAIVGSSDTGKSTFLRDFAMNIVLKEKTFLDLPLNPKRGAALYVSTEDDKFAMSFLLQKQSGKEADAKSYAKLRFIFETQDLIQRITDAIAQQPVDCIIIDSFGDVMVGDINRSTHVRNFLDKFVRIAIKNELLVIFLHHMTKRADQNNPSKQFVEGSQAFEAKMRLVAELRKDRECIDYRHFCVLKGNYIPNQYKGKSFVLGFDDHLRFMNMGERTSFNSLSCKAGTQDWDKIKAKAKELKISGKSVREITDQLNEEGFKVGKSKVAEIVKEVA